MSGKEIPVENCEMCGTPVPGFEYERCCYGFDCGCMGRPIVPCVCSEKCWDDLISRNREKAEPLPTQPFNDSLPFMGEI